MLFHVSVLLFYSVFQTFFTLWSPLPLREHSLFVVLCVLFVTLDGSGMQMRSAVTHTLLLQRTCRSTASLFFPENLPLCDPLKRSAVLVFHQWPISLVYSVNDKLLCLIMTALSPAAGGGQVQCVCMWGEEGEPFSALLWESSHNPPHSENAISIHDSSSHEFHDAQPRAWTHTSRWKTDRALRCSGQLR